jgi:hypothetical protein
MAWKQDFAKSFHIIKIVSYYRNREISILIMEGKKNPTAELTLLQEATESSNLGKKKTNRKQKTLRYEQKCQSHTCSGTINSSMYDNDLTTTTSPLTSSAPYSG